MKYTVKVLSTTKEIEAARFHTAERLVVFTNDQTEPVAAYPAEFIESIESDAVTREAPGV